MNGYLSEPYFHFLDTEKIQDAICRIIAEAQNEIVIVVPYISTSRELYALLCDADQRGVEMLLICRSIDLNETEKSKLYALRNLNLMSHPTVHAKCYMNEELVVLGSMNMYEYSEKNNKEMGVLFDRLSEQTESHRFIDDIKKELRLIVNGSVFEKRSQRSEVHNLRMEIIKTELEKKEEFCQRVNTFFHPKKFEVIAENGSYNLVCREFFNKFDLTMSYRAILTPKYDEENLKRLYNRVSPALDEYMIPGFKLYWNSYHQDIYLYKDKYPDWDEMDQDEEFARIEFGLNRLYSVLMG